MTHVSYFVININANICLSVSLHYTATSSR